MSILLRAIEMISKMKSKAPTFEIKAFRDNECSTCGEWYTEDGNECLQCLICEQWFHETCFLRLNLIFDLV